MAGFTSFPLRLGLLAAALLAFGATGAPAQDKVGVNSAVNPQAAGTPPGGTTRQLVIGEDVLFNERITTGPAGQTQLLFVDESSMTVGANSDLTIDQFVYDPKSGTGKLAMSATRGLLRYVGGKLSKQDEGVTLRTTTATLAVRGGAFIARIGDNGETRVIFIYGRGLTVIGVNGGSQTVRRPGFQIIIARGGPPSPPTRVPTAELAQTLAELDGRPGGSGGARVIPTEAAVAQSGISQTISGDLVNSLQQTTQNQLTPAQLSQLNVASVQSSTNPQPNLAVDCAVTQTCPPVVIVQLNPQPPQPPLQGPPSNPNMPPPQVTISYAGQVKKSSDLARGFVNQNPIATASADGQVAYAGGTLTFPDGSPQQGVFTGSFGALGSLTFPLAPGRASFGPQGTSSSFGSFSGDSFLAADDTFFYATLTPTNNPGQRLFVFGGTPVSQTALAPTGNTRIFAFSVQPDSVLQSNIPFIRSQVGGNLPNATVSPLFVAAPPTTAIGATGTTSAARGLQASLAVSGQGANQQSAIAMAAGTFGSQSNGQPIFIGTMRGSSLISANATPARLSSSVTSTVDGAGNSIYGGNAISGFVLDQGQVTTNPSGSGMNATVAPDTAFEVPLSGKNTTYGFAQPVLPEAVPSGIGAIRSTRAISGSFGGLMYTTAQATPYAVGGGTIISTDAPNNRIQASLIGNALSPSTGVNSLDMEFGALTGSTHGREAYIDDNTFGVGESFSRNQQINGKTLVVNGDPTDAGKLYLVSSGAAGAPASLLPPNTSYCQCQFLQWGYWGGDLRTGNSVDSTIQRIDRGHINTWVAGVATPFNDLNSLISQAATFNYTGHAIGSVFNNGASYIAAGGMNGTYSFGTQSGTFALTNFDGRNFAVSGKAPLNGASYTFSLNQPGVSGSVNGTFFGPLATETGGNFAFQSTVGPTYLASGIFAAKR